MADPIDYNPSYSFSAFQSVNPTTPLPAAQVDTQLADIGVAIRDHADAIKDVRRSDGKIQNGSVTYDSLASDLQAQVGIGIEEALLDAQAAQEAAEAAAADSIAAAAKMVGSSTTSTAIGTGSKTFTTQSGKYFFVGCPVIVSSNANPTVNYMTGLVTGYTGTSLTVGVTAIGGGGMLTDWTIRVSGTPGQQGATGPSGSGAGDMLKTENLSGLANYTSARANLGLAALAVKNTVATADIDDDAVTASKIPNAVLPYDKLASSAIALTVDISNATAGKLVDAATLKNYLDTYLRPYDQTIITNGGGATALFTGIPAGVRRIIITPAQMRSTSTATFTLQLGPVGGIETSGYNGAYTFTNTGVGNAANSTSFGIVNSQNAANNISGVITLIKVDDNANRWVASGMLAINGNTTLHMAGDKPLASVLERLQISCSAGNFNSGRIRVQAFFA